MRRRSSIGSIQAFLAQGEDAIEITKSRHPHYTRNAGPVSRSLLKNRTTNQSVAIYAPASDRKDQGPTPDVVADEYAAAHEKKGSTWTCWNCIAPVVRLVDSLA